MNCASVVGRRFSAGGTTCSCAPAANVPKISNTDRSKCRGGWQETLSDGPMPKYFVAHSTKWITLAWVMTTPLGVPVDPEVKRMCAASLRAPARGGGVPDTRSRSRAVKRVVKRSVQAGRPRASRWRRRRSRGGRSSARRVSESEAPPPGSTAVAGVEDLRQTGRRARRVEGHVDAPGLVDPDERHDGLRRLRHEEAHPVALAAAALPEDPRQPVRPNLQLGVSQERPPPTTATASGRRSACRVTQSASDSGMDRWHDGRRGPHGSDRRARVERPG